MGPTETSDENVTRLLSVLRAASLLAQAQLGTAATTAPVDKRPGNRRGQRLGRIGRVSKIDRGTNYLFMRRTVTDLGPGEPMRNSPRDCRKWPAHKSPLAGLPGL
jgi:hypothetical protein